MRPYGAPSSGRYQMVRKALAQLATDQNLELGEQLLASDDPAFKRYA